MEDVGRQVGEVGDGEQELRRGRVNVNLRKGTKLIDALKQVADRLGVDTKEAYAKAKADGLSGVDAIGQVLQGGVLQGAVGKAMDQIAKAAGYDWMIQNQTLKFTRRDQADASASIFLTPISGLIGSPELGENTGKVNAKRLVKIRSLLQPGIYPGRRILLDSEGLQGSFRAEKVIHTGDTHAQDWYTDIEASPL
jgi:hypothetical protein